MQYLSQDLILLALNPQTGKTRFSLYSALDYGLVGSLLLDLVLQGKLEIDNDNRVIGAISQRYLLKQIAGNTGNEFLDQRLNEVLASSRSRTARFWVTRWRRRYRAIQTIVLQNLVNLGVLERQKQRILGLFPTQRYFLTDESIQREIVQQVRAAVLEGIGLDSRMAALISLMQASHLTDAVFRPEERPEARPCGICGAACELERSQKVSWSVKQFQRQFSPFKQPQLWVQSIADEDSTETNLLFTIRIWKKSTIGT